LRKSRKVVLTVGVGLMTKASRREAHV
jgi:hypothetical protein